MDEELERVFCECKGEAWESKEVFHVPGELNPIMKGEKDRVELSSRCHPLYYFEGQGIIISSVALTTTITTLLPALRHLPGNMFWREGPRGIFLERIRRRKDIQ